MERKVQITKNVINHDFNGSPMKRLKITKNYQSSNLPPSTNCNSNQITTEHEFESQVCFEFWKNATCTNRNCRNIHKRLLLTESIENILSYFYFLLKTKSWEALIEIYHLFLTNVEISKTRSALITLTFALLNDDQLTEAFSLVGEIERIKITDPLILWKFLSKCHNLPPEQRQLRSDFINYLLTTNAKLEPHNLREALDNLVMLPDKKDFWNFVLFAVKHKFNPSSMTCTLAIETLIEEKFHIQLVLKLILKMSKDEFRKINPKNVEFVREMVIMFCVTQNLTKLDDFLNKFGLNLGKKCEVRVNERHSSLQNQNISCNAHNNSLIKTTEIKKGSACDEKVWNNFLRNDEITEEDFGILFNHFVQNLKNAAENYELLHSFAETRMRIENPSEMIEVASAYWFIRLGIDLMMCCYQKKESQEAFKILSKMRDLSVDFLLHYSHKRSVLLRNVIQICFITDNESTASDILKSSPDLNVHDYIELMLNTSSKEEVEALTFIITTLNFHRNGY